MSDENWPWLFSFRLTCCRGSHTGAKHCQYAAKNFRVMSPLYSVNNPPATPGQRPEECQAANSDVTRTGLLSVSQIGECSFT